MLDDFIATHREEIIARARKKASSRSGLQPNDADLDKGIPLFLDHLAITLRSTLRHVAREPGAPSATGHAAAFGGDFQRTGSSIAQVVHGYGDVCQTVTELALEREAPIAVDEFRLFNGCLDDAIADAVTEFERRREAQLSSLDNERVTILADDLRSALHTAMLAFGVMKRGAVGPDSSTMALLNRSLTRLHDLLEQSIAEVRLESGVPQTTRIALAALIEDAEIASALEAGTRRVTFKVASTPGLEVTADAALLAGALADVLQNAFKHTPAGGCVLLTTRAAAGRALIAVEDASGRSLEKAEECFHERDPSGSRVGSLFSSRKSVRAMNGDIHVRSLAALGCVFTIDLPLAPSRT